MLENINTIIYDMPYWQLYVLTFLYFVFLYFVLAPLFLKACEFLYKHGKLEKIILESASKKQLLFEKKHSFQSIVIFGFSILPIIFMVRNNNITFIPNTITNIVAGLIILTIWNEIHFFIVHHLMHLPFFMKRVHKVHHKSKITTVYSVYSFHWFEALLLSTVPLTLLLFIDVSSIAIALYPLLSVFVNYIGHCNYRFGNGTGKKWTLLATNHNEHHYVLRKNYAFTFNILDVFYVKLSNLSKKQNQ